MQEYRAWRCIPRKRAQLPRSTFSPRACVYFGKRCAIYLVAVVTVCTAMISCEHSAPTRRALFPVSRNGKWGFVDATGTVVIEPQFDSAKDFREGLALVRLGRDFLYVSSDGKTISVPRGALSAWSFSCGRARFHDSQGAVGYLDRSGQVVIEPQFAYGESFSEGIARVEVLGGAPDNDRRWGFIREDGTWLIPPRFTSCMSFHDGLAWVREGDKKNVSTKQERLHLKPKFRRVGSLHRQIRFPKAGLVSHCATVKNGISDL